jgi:hypothetical protein
VGKKGIGWWLGLGGIGVGSALLWRSLMGPRPRLILTVRPAQPSGLGYVEPGWEAGLGDFHAVSVKIADGRDGNYNAGPLFAGADAGGCRRWSWSFNYLKGGGDNYQRTREEAVAAADAAIRWGSELHAVNAEHAAFGISGDPAPDIAGRCALFADVFLERAPGVKLAWNGLTYTSYMMSNGAWVDGLNASSLARYEFVNPMIYRESSDSAAWRKRQDELWAGARDKCVNTFGKPWGPMTGSGRIAGDGTAWLWAFDRDGQPGLLSLVQRYQPDYLAFFYGAGSKPQLTQQEPGNPNPPLVQLAPMIHAAYRGQGVG